MLIRGRKDELQKRTILLIIVWLILFAVLRGATSYYGYVCGVASVDESGITLEFAVFCLSSRYLTVQRTLNEEIINMCQRNGIRLAVNRSLLETGGEPAEEEKNDQI